MAAGVLTLSTGRKFDVDSNSCFHAIESLMKIRTLNQTAAVCSADPVVNASTVTFTYSTTPTSVVHTVTNTTATALSAADLGNKSADWSHTPFLLQAVLVVAAVFIVFMGYRAGDKT
ncbi:hypothetical protein MCEMIEM13_01628 [Comamonadaceae bacterium]